MLASAGTIPGPTSLRNFRCQQGAGHFPVAGEWCKEILDQYGSKRYYSTHFDLEKVLHNPFNYERFIATIPYGPVKDRPLSIDGDLTMASRMSVNGEIFAYCGNTAVLDTSRGRKGFHLPSCQRVIFVPSKGRWDVDDITINLTWKADGTVRILIVPMEEISAYGERFGHKGWLIISPVCDPHRTIGSARACILKLARFWDLAQIWMMDDSVPTGMIKETSFCPFSDRRTPTHDMPIAFHIAVQRVEHAMASPEEVLVDADNIFRNVEDEHWGPVAMIGLPSTRSVENIRDSDPQVNHRTPTSLILLNLNNIPDTLTYDSRLRYKEDVIFAGRLIQAGLKIVVYRELHFTDTYLAIGGCSEYRHS